MICSEYRKQFKSVEEFKLAFGKLTEEEALALISAEESSYRKSGGIYHLENGEERGGR